MNRICPLLAVLVFTPVIRADDDKPKELLNVPYGTHPRQVLDFYNFRDTSPEKVFPRATDGTVQKYDDLPPKYHVNVDVTDPPFDRQPGDRPAMTAQDEADVIAFLKTLTDGYQPEP